MTWQDVFNIIVLLMAWGAHSRIDAMQKRNKQ